MHWVVIVESGYAIATTNQSQTSITICFDKICDLELFYPFCLSDTAWDPRRIHMLYEKMTSAWDSLDVESFLSCFHEDYDFIWHSMGKVTNNFKQHEEQP